jgi:epoxyqueuosine reductase
MKNKRELEEVLRDWATERGYRIAWYDGAIVRRAFEGVRVLKADGAIDLDFFAKFLSWTEGPEPLTKAGARTVLLLAVPRPAHILSFEDRGSRHDFILPPTYLRYAPLFDEVLADLTSATGDALKLRRLSAPLKTIAGLAGFARYGKNNIVYIEGFGSGAQLMGFASDLPLLGCDIPPENAPLVLDECRACRACLRACPAKAIVEDRFLVHGEKCLTGFSESEGDVPAEFARLLTPTLIGCLACQDHCPANRGLLRFERLSVTFSSDETAYLLGERGDGPPAPVLVEKVQALGLSDITVGDAGPSSIFRRNLRAHLRSAPATEEASRPGSMGIKIGFLIAALLSVV